jgi:hypothetical protein
MSAQRPLLVALVALLVALAGCDSDRYAIVEVRSDLSTVMRLQVITAVDGAGRATELPAPDNAPLAWPRTFSVELAPSASSVHVAVFALDASGATVGVGDLAVAPQSTTVVVLAPPKSSCTDGQLCCSTLYCEDGRHCGDPGEPCCDGRICPAASTACLSDTCQRIQ